VTICLKEGLGSSKEGCKILRTHNKPLPRQEHNTEDLRSIKKNTAFREVVFFCCYVYAVMIMSGSVIQEFTFIISGTSTIKVLTENKVTSYNLHIQHT